LTGDEEFDKWAQQVESPSSPIKHKGLLLLILRLPDIWPWLAVIALLDGLGIWLLPSSWIWVAMASLGLVTFSIVPKTILMYVTVTTHDKSKSQQLIELMRHAGLFNTREARSKKIRLQLQRYLTGLSAQTLTDFAAILAGRKRLGLREEWRSHLAGDSGHDPANWKKVKEAFGFLISAVRFRCSDVTDIAWTPVDAILKSRILSNLFVLIPTAIATYPVLHHEGALGVVSSAESIIAIAAAFYGLIRTGRWWRDIKPREPKARRRRNDTQV
jgi:hypothetical protein